MTKTIEIDHPHVDIRAQLVVNPTDEGLVIDLYDLGGVNLIATWAVLYQDIAMSLVGRVPIELVDPIFDTTQGN